MLVTIFTGVKLYFRLDFGKRMRDSATCVRKEHSAGRPVTHTLCGHRRELFLNHRRGLHPSQDRARGRLCAGDMHQHCHRHLMGIVYSLVARAVIDPASLRPYAVGLTNSFSPQERGCARSR